MCKSLVSPVLLLCSFASLSQTPATPASRTASFPDESVVVEQDDVVHRFAADGTGTRLETSAVRVQSSAALQSLAVLGFAYASGTQRLDIVYARVRKPDGTVVETPVTDVQDQPAQVTQAAPMYSDLHVKQLPVRSLAVGDKLEFQVRMTQQQPEVPGEFWGQENFGQGAVYLKRTIELHVPKQKRLTVYSPANPAQITEAGDERVYHWSGTQLRPTASKEDAPAPEKTSPVAWTTFASWEAIGLWYRGLLQGRDAVAPAIQAKADELTVNAKTDTEKVRALYDYVSTHNHYIGIDFGIGRYQPHAAAEVMANQYGDCKDKHTLLAALLRAKGLLVSAVLIGAGIEMNEAVPMPAAFNHLITQVDVGGDKVWLDATTEVAPYRVLLPLLRDKQALVVPAATPPHLEKTPAQLPFPALTRYEAKMDLDKSGTLKGHIDIAMRGDDEIYMRLAVRQMTRAQWDQFTQNITNSFGFSGTPTAAVLDSADDTANPWHLRFDYTQPAYSDWKNYRIGALLPNLGLTQLDEKKPPTKEIELGAPRTLLYETTTHLPEGYSLELPDAVHVKTPFAIFDRSYRLANNTLQAELKLEFLTAKLPAAQWKDYNKFLDDMGQEPWIQVTAKDRASGEKGPPAAGENNPVAAELVRQAIEAVHAQNKELARKKLDQALAVNEKQRSLWAELAYLAALDGKYDITIEDYRKELTLYPNTSEVYPGIIDAQERLGKKADERDTLLAYAKAEPNKDFVVLMTGSRLLANDYLNDAIDVYRAGTKAMPDNKVIKAELGSALLRAGKAEEAVPLLKTSLEGESDPNILNNAAYVLIDHNVELPLAEASARKAIDLLETETVQQTLDSVNARSFARVNILLATWDTLGWAYFAEGKTDLAEQYIRAAWISAASAETGLHLGKILEKQGKPVQAMQLYELASAGRKGASPTVVDAALKTAIDALKKQKVPSQYPHPETILQDQRTFRIPRPASLKGSAIFLAQVSSTKTEKVQFLSGDEAFRPQAEALAHLDLSLAIPKDSHALLLRSGVLFCSTQPTCEFVLTPPASANVK